MGPFNQGSQNSKTPTPATPPQRNRSSMLRSAYPPPGDTPLDFLAPPTKLVIYAALGLPPPGGDPLDRAVGNGAIGATE